MKVSKPPRLLLALGFVIFVLIFDIVSSLLWRLACFLLVGREWTTLLEYVLVSTSPYFIAGLIVGLLSMLFARYLRLLHSFYFGVSVVLCSAFFRTFVLRHLVIRGAANHILVFWLYSSFISAALVGVLSAGLLLWVFHYDHEIYTTL